MSASERPPTDVFAPLITERVVAGVCRRLAEDDGVVFHAPAHVTHTAQSVEVLPVGQMAFGDPAYFELVRHLAQDTAQRLERIDRRIFSGWMRRRDLRDAFVVVVGLRLAVRILPAVLSFLGGPHRTSRTVLVNTGLHAQQIPAIERYLELPAGGARCRCICTASDRFLARLQDEFMRPRPEAEELLAGLPAGASLVICGAESETARLGDLVEVLTDRGGCVVLSKTDSPGNVRASEQLAARGAAGVIDATAFGELGTDRATTVSFLRTVARLRKSYGRLEPERQEFALLHLVTLLTLVRNAGSLERVVDVLGPPLIAGALERSAFGAVSLLFREPERCAVACLQHGTVLPVNDMDLQPYDALLAWNARSKAAYMNLRFADEARVRVVGNPNWDALSADRDEHGSGGDRRADLRAWASGAPVLAVFPQPVKGPFMSSLSERALYEWLRALLMAHDAVRVVVKMRADALPPEFVRAYEPLREVERVRFVDAANDALADVLAVADVGISIVSAALNDALAAGVPAVSVDIDGVMGAFDFHDAVRVCRTQTEFERAIAECLASGPGTAIADPDLLPSFDVSFPDRLETALDALEVLPPARARR